MMGDLAKGITSFKKGLRDDGESADSGSTVDAPRISSQPAPPAEPAAEPAREDGSTS
jgi:hypothetical protein